MFDVQSDILCAMMFIGCFLNSTALRLIKKPDKDRQKEERRELKKVQEIKL